ncbi:hypothetical protein U1Q18_052471 [Sarracenia purpurea var. burkii]
MRMRIFLHKGAVDEMNHHKWNPSEKRMYKLNFNGERRKNGKSGIGVVIRDESGQVFVSLSERLRWDGSPETIEAWETLRAMEEALSMGLNNIHLKGDALAIIQAIKKKEKNLSFIGAIIKAIKRMASFFLIFHCSHVKREGNSVVHSLAQQALRMEGNLIRRNYQNPKMRSFDLNVTLHSY